MNEVEQLVIKNLLLEEEYVRKALPFIKSEYFADLTGKRLFEVIHKYFTKEITEKLDWAASQEFKYGS